MTIPADATRPPASDRYDHDGLDELPSAWTQRGLSASDIARRVEDGQVNRVEDQASQSWGQILRRNAFTRLNFLLLVLGGATLVTGSAPDATFLAIAVINTVVGATQEARAKRSLDALAVINAPRARVIRDGEVQEIAPEEIVVDDLLELRPGDQLTADATVVTDQGAEVDESLVTGESDPTPKSQGDSLTSGSWLVAGGLQARVTRVGDQSYANRLAEQARRFDLASSELMRGINQVLRWLTWAMVVIGPILFLRQLQSEPWQLAVRLAVAGLVGMIPEGLVLLTTLAFLAAALRLGRRQVLVQQLPAVETLARVDALCADKTGTLTEGRIAFSGLQAASARRADVESALVGLSTSPGANATMAAIREAISSPQEWAPLRQVPFSSARKWSGATFEGHGSWVIGAPEVVIAADPEGFREQASQLAASGSRVLALAAGSAGFDGERLPDDLALVALVELRERTRPAVAATLAYFSEQDVTVRVISGDNPATVGALAERVGLSGANLTVDARSLPDDPERFAESVDANRVFGRVSPEQKRRMVRSLKQRGHTVAMTGDGVNDALALKDADLGVAMGSGSAISRGVAEVVILDDDFDRFPSVVAEGRRVLANIETVAILFLVKNVYSLALSVATSVTGWPYPFLPRHLTLISAVGIGIPGFFLAMAPNQRRFRSGFLRRVLSFSIPVGAVTSVAVLLTYATAREEGLSGDAARTAAVIVTAVVSLWVLALVARPLTRPRLLLIMAMAGLFVAVYLIPGINSFFAVQHHPGLEVTLQALGFGAAACAVITVLHRHSPTRYVSSASGRASR